MVLLEKIKVKNYMSLRDVDLELKNLNVLIGVNGSGKSNLMDVFSLMKEAASGSPKENPLRNAIIKKRRGMNELLWDSGGESREIKFDFAFKDDGEITHFFNKFRFSLVLEQRSNDISAYDIASEIFMPIESEVRMLQQQHPNTNFSHFYDFKDGFGEFFKITKVNNEPHLYALDGDVDFGLNHEKELALIQKTDNRVYPFVSRLQDYISSWSIHTEFDTSRNAPMRLPQEVYTEKHLSEHGDNLPLVLKYLSQFNKDWDKIKKHLEDVYEYFKDVTFIGEGAGREHLHWKEKHLNKALPASRLSDGMLRFLCLLAILCDPEPPPLICLDEPEIGFHPDILLPISELLMEASKKTQIIVTTHSPDLVSCFENPENIVVTERGEGGGTKFRRLSAEELKPWLEENISLGSIWRRNLFGGNRW